jgi:hypothetical protein
LEERLCYREDEIDTLLCAGDMLAGASRYHRQRESEGDDAMAYSKVSSGMSINDFIIVEAANAPQQLGGTAGEPRVPHF